MNADHVVIGSGINALVAAGLLAVKGERVLVLEREARIGGCLHTDEVTLPGFRHDVLAATFVLFLTSPAHAALGADLARHGLEFCHTPHPTAVVRPDGSSLVLTTDRKANVARWSELNASDGPRHASDVGGIERDAPFLFALLGGDLWSWPMARLMLGQLRQRGVRGLAGFFGQALAPARGWLESSYTSPLVQALWAPWVLHTGLTPESTYSGQMGKVIAFALEAAGAPVVKGGAGAAADAFARLIKARGGTIRVGADVDRIEVSGGRATGVVLSTGERIAAGKSVLASVTPGQLHGRLLRDLKLPESPETVRTYRHGRGNFQLHYALDRPPEWLSPGLDKVALIHLADGIDSVSRSSNEAERGLLPAEPTICVGQPHALDPTRCPPGKAIIWVQVPDAPRHLKGDAAGTIATTGTWTDATREAFADRIEALIARHIRDFASIKLARRAFSPSDLEKLNMNLVGGDPYGGACTIDQFFVFRPTAAKMPAKNLHLIGASAHPGPGLGGVSGYLAAKRLGA